MPVSVCETALPGVLVITPQIYADDRGFFYESFNSRSLAKAIGKTYGFVQDNHSKSSRGVLRGLHYQVCKAQGKLVRVIEGVIFDVAVDIRKGSPTFGKWFGIELSAANNKQLWVPPDFAHGFMVTSETAQVLYKTTEFYAPEYERCIIWDDPEIGIDWPKISCPLTLSGKDMDAMSLHEAELPSYIP